MTRIRIITPIRWSGDWMVDILILDHRGHTWRTIGWGPTASDALRDAIGEAEVNTDPDASRYHSDYAAALPELRAALADEEAK